VTAHEIMAALSAVRANLPSEIRVHPSSVVLRYGAVEAVVRREGWVVLFPKELADRLMVEGVGARAQRAVVGREGTWHREPGPEFRLAQAEFRAALADGVPA